MYLTLIIPLFVKGQDKLIDPHIKLVLDSLDRKIAYLEKTVQERTNNRDAKYFSTKRELEMVKFERTYEELIYDEDLVTAETLIDKKIKASEKRYDTFAEKYYNGYASSFTKLRADKQRHYQLLFAKEKNFRKEYEKYIEVVDEYSLQRAMRMIDLAINYAKSQGREETLKYLNKYKNNTKALMLDLNSGFDLAKFTRKVSKYEGYVDPLLTSDSLQDIQIVEKIVAQCHEYSSLTETKVSPGYFDKQKIVVANAISDWNERQGFTAELSELTGAATVSRFDSLNREGIYQWNHRIVVIGVVNFSSKAEMVRRGEIIINADRTLLKYIRVNRYANIKSDKAVKTTGTFIIPYNENGIKKYYNLSAFAVKLATKKQRH